MDLNIIEIIDSKIKLVKKLGIETLSTQQYKFIFNCGESEISDYIKEYTKFKLLTL